MDLVIFRAKFCTLTYNFIKTHFLSAYTSAPPKKKVLINYTFTISTYLLAELKKKTKHLWDVSIRFLGNS